MACLNKLQLGIHVRFKHGKDLKTAKLVLWTCGDVEKNPGPGNSRSEILRKFRKSQQTRILKMIHKMNGSSEPKPLYKEIPEWWPPGVPFVNISNQGDENESRECFDALIDLLLRNKSTIPSEFLSVLSCYKDLDNSRRKNKQSRGHGSRVSQCKQSLIAWMEVKNTEKVLYSKRSSYHDDLRGLLCLLKEQQRHGEPIPDDIKDLCREIASTEREESEDKILSGVTTGKRKYTCSSCSTKEEVSPRDFEVAASKKAKLDATDGMSLSPTLRQKQVTNQVLTTPSTTIDVTSQVENNDFSKGAQNGLPVLDFLIDDSEWTDNTEMQFDDVDAFLDSLLV
ncbi:hypothetical protein FSP39_018808 [Pinctada imbricata]|uniref:Uncharacterized protein n=1 Tax=Pinctada imbricata TaxID=66713 RepID=A0AA88YIT7_PINIB|nr:hypothetical protein FSP39_018808 [Pinctada imbricata]